MAYDTEDSSRNADFLWTSPYGREGSGAFGARVLSFVCFAPNDGFGPQSGLVQRGVLYTAAWGSENHTTALRAWKCIPPLVAGATTFPPRWEACHWILSRLRLPTNPVPLPPQAGALWMLSHGAMSPQESIERFILSPGWGKVRRSRIRGSRAAANHQNAYYAI